MSKPRKNSLPALAARRQALVTECALQRINAAREIREIVAPVHKVRQKLGGNLAIPLSALGVVAGLIAARKGKLMPMITSGLALIRLGRESLAAWRQRS